MLFLGAAAQQKVSVSIWEKVIKILKRKIVIIGYILSFKCMTYDNTCTFYLVFVCFFISFEKVGADDARGGVAREGGG